MSVKTFDPKGLIVTFGGIPITGFMDGEAIVVSRDEDSFTKSSGLDGEVVRVKNLGRMGNVKIVLQQTSDSNNVLSAASLADEATNSGIAPFLIKDMNGTTLCFAAHAWVKKPADTGFEKGAVSGREWVLDTGAIDMFVGGN